MILNSFWIAHAIYHVSELRNLISPGACWSLLYQLFLCPQFFLQIWYPRGYPRRQVLVVSCSLQNKYFDQSVKLFTGLLAHIRCLVSAVYECTQVVCLLPRDPSNRRLSKSLNHLSQTHGIFLKRQSEVCSVTCFWNFIACWHLFLSISSSTFCSPLSVLQNYWQLAGEIWYHHILKLL